MPSKMKIAMKHRAFTVIEMLVVIACICALAGLIFAVGRPMQRRAKERAALNDITAIYSAFQQFKLKYGIFPGEVNGAGGLKNRLIHTLIREKMLAIEYKQLKGDKDDGSIYDSFGKPYCVIIDPAEQGDFTGTPSGANSELKNFRWQESGVYIYSSAGYEPTTDKKKELTDFIYVRNAEP